MSDGRKIDDKVLENISGAGNVDFDQKVKLTDTSDEPKDTPSEPNPNPGLPEDTDPTADAPHDGPGQNFSN